ncbi:lipoprotein releasing system, transmembrane protein, LolC/E family [Fusobacterium gonidiaformans 3-1-5R]|uniref:Lipoprotein releasing system, transmembrane protein, LolC/E family n=1 Tax=Fusobacterium gonidiaformans 3-1-5R TaxID=469605 RepID=E5BDK9_9FUSO|nr:ABC transporter permease [Fusobacterium gonidiaformans]EFS21135.1 lipoprotein releasing system, transmembrane protein, LolC/E family [Fusobacterium gonidiaformans 3-1-5R]
MIEFFIAKKHIVERKKQSFISMLGVFIGVTVLTVSIGISNGLDKNMIQSILSLTSHILVSDSTNQEIVDYEELSEKINQIKGVKGSIPMISTQAIIKYHGVFGNYTSGVKVEAYDLEKAEKALELSSMIKEGKIDIEKKNGIYVGKELADSTGMKIGDEITMVSAENTEIPLQIAGVFQSGFYDYDVNLVLLPLEMAQYMSYRGQVVDKINVRLQNPYDAPRVADEISQNLSMMTMTWGNMNRNLLSALSLEKTVMILVFSLIVIIAGFVVWVTLNTLVREKVKDIGILRSMGFSQKNIMGIFLIQGLILGVAGIILGICVSLGILWYLKNYSLAFITSIYYLTKIPIEISGKEIAVIVGANLGIIFISSIFPAYRASKMESVEALRHE